MSEATLRKRQQPPADAANNGTAENPRIVWITVIISQLIQLGANGAELNSQEVSGRNLLRRCANLKYSDRTDIPLGDANGRNKGLRQGADAIAELLVKAGIANSRAEAMRILAVFGGIVLGAIEGRPGPQQSWLIENFDHAALAKQFGADTDGSPRGG